LAIGGQLHFGLTRLAVSAVFVAAVV
jgi:hypothetical protein